MSDNNKPEPPTIENSLPWPTPPQPISLPWRRMETAPQDGPVILYDGGYIFTGFWLEGDGWVTGYDDGMLRVQVSLKPTGWSPMIKGPYWDDRPIPT
jgi:hypothetical protein